MGLPAVKPGKERQSGCLGVREGLLVNEPSRPKRSDRERVASRMTGLKAR